jgi:UDP-3-O-[3-hydroxymyristoyl] glucosamine N-acyltransferase
MSYNKYDEKRLRFARERLKSRTETFIEPYTYIGPNVRIGKGCYIKSCSSIGQKGFSWGHKENLDPVEMWHEGGVILGNGVEIGACCSVAGATLWQHNTVLGDFVKLDDNIHIAHNCHIGRGTIIAASVSFGGSVYTGKYCFFGLNCSIKNGIKIGNYAVIGMGAVVIGDVPDKAIMVGNPAKLLRYRDDV